MNFLTIVAPAYNEESLIAQFILEVVKSVENITEDYELIIVDDGSQDQTWQKIATIAKENNKIKALKLSKNFGHHYAITAGLFESNGTWTVVMDSDLQDRPEVICELLIKAQEGYDVVFVNRVSRPESLIYKFFQKFFYLVLNFLSGLEFDSRQANFSIINHKVVKAFKLFPENGRFYGSMIKWLGFNRTSINAKHGKRLNGKPSYTLKKRIVLAIDIILSYSQRPLILSVIFGITLSLISIIITVLIILNFFLGGYEVLWWTSIIVSILFTSGGILTMIGILGIYIGRIYNEVKLRPLFVVSERLNFTEAK